MAESSGVPLKVSRKGKAPPLERGRGKAFPACEPDRVTAKALWSEEIMVPLVCHHTPYHASSPREVRVSKSLSPFIKIPMLPKRTCLRPAFMLAS